jgi:acetyl esterase/lipase
MKRAAPFLAAAAAALLTLIPGFAGPEPASQPLWPGQAPDPNPVTGPEGETSTASSPKVAGRSVSRIGNISVPTLTVYAPAKPNGTAVVVCPGGGYKLLSMDLEGTELCQWLNSLGVTAILLKYRVPDSGPYPIHNAALDDAQRCLGLVRSHAADWHIDPSKVGIMGFSAGGHLAAALSTHWKSRIYPHVDAADDQSCRPDFAFVIYPGNIVDPANSFVMNPDVPVVKDNPPAFIIQAEDDRNHVDGAIAYALACSRAGVPVEFHLYPSGGHGFGIRVTDKAVTRWPDLAAKWLAARGLLPAAP